MVNQGWKCYYPASPRLKGQSENVSHGPHHSDMSEAERERPQNLQSHISWKYEHCLCLLFYLIRLKQNVRKWSFPDTFCQDHNDNNRDTVYMI